MQIETRERKKIAKTFKIDSGEDRSEFSKEGFNYFMLKEIFEQPKVLQKNLTHYFSEEMEDLFIFDKIKMNEDVLLSIQKIVIVSCGSSWHAGLIGQHYIESLSQIPVSVEYASEFRYRESLIDEHTLVLAISQSGETADTVSSVKEAKKYGAQVVVICNVPHSSLTQETPFVLHTHAGVEIGVASTKTFTCQLAVLYFFAIDLGRKRKMLSKKKMVELIENFKKIPSAMTSLLTEENLKKIQSISNRYYNKANFLYLGRGLGFALALEGALKLKEISYIHAEGCHAGEMKHGPIALIDQNMPTVVLALRGRRYDKIISNIKEIKARDGQVVAIVSKGDRHIDRHVDEVIEVPFVESFLTPFVTVIPLQIFAYDMAVKRPTDVDHPRNLAKSVTVE